MKTTIALIRRLVLNQSHFIKTRYLNFFILFALLWGSAAHATDVAFAGFAYSGDSKSIQARFPYSKQFEQSLGNSGMNALLREALPNIKPKAYRLVPRIDQLVGQDQAIAVAMVITNETVTTEEIAGVYKLLVQLRGQAVFFDFKSKTIVRAYPFSFAYLDALAYMPSEEQKLEAIRTVYLGKNDKPGMISRFSEALTNATIPSGASRYVQVVNVKINDAIRTHFPESYGKGVAETWIADTFGEAIANKVGIPILPYSKGYAIGNVMSMTVADGSVYNLTLPKPDYEFSVDISNLRKVVYEEKASGTSYIYGAYATLKLEEPLSGHIYLNGDYKNGEVKVVSSLQANTEDFPAFQDAIRGLFTKFAVAVSGGDTAWVKSATTGKDTNKQISSTKELLKSCK